MSCLKINTKSFGILNTITYLYYRDYNQPNDNLDHSRRLPFHSFRSSSEGGHITGLKSTTMKARAKIMEVGPRTYHVKTKTSMWLVEGKKELMMLVSELNLRVVSFHSMFAYSVNPL